MHSSLYSMVFGSWAEVVFPTYLTLVYHEGNGMGNIITIKNSITTKFFIYFKAKVYSNLNMKVQESRLHSTSHMPIMSDAIN